ncbi:MAG: ATP-binding cassette domain-containing protein [Muribaculaceae bacterium]|nr:ATP-binding cassette domain-containing protein [Muribaculaceae bacterium]
MQIIELRDALPRVFAGREPVPSQVWQCQLRLERGKHYLIVAESGTGKSSMCSYIYGYRRDYSGTITFDGADIGTLTVPQWCEVRRTGIAYLPQEMRLFGELTALENVQLKNRLTNHKSEEEILGLFARLGLADKVHTPAARLSIGQQQRVAIVRTLCQQADFFLLDEPVSHLDETNNAIVAQLFTAEADRQGAAIIVTSVGNHLLLDYDEELRL